VYVNPLGNIMLFTILLGLFLSTVDRVPLKIKFSNLEPNKTIRVAFYASEEGFTKPEYIKYSKEEKAGSSNIYTMTFNQVPYGTYAVAVFQDLNSDKKIDVNAVGYPTEPFAFSNNIKPRFSRPKYQDCKFNYSETANEISIKML
jgi:uncharacterized protein (DUF2141 family)